MNGLSWLIYLADVADNLDNLLSFMQGAGLVGGVILGIAAFVGADEMEAKDWATWRRVAFRLTLPAFLTGALVGSVVPSKETIYAIAASEMGEEVLDGTEGRAMKALNSWLDRQIAGEEAPAPTEKK
jgi:hypothetical protein